MLTTSLLATATFDFRLPLCGGLLGSTCLGFGGWCFRVGVMEWGLVQLVKHS